MVEWTLSDDGILFVVGSNDLRDWVYNFRTMRTIGSSERVNRLDRYEALQVLRGIRGVTVREVRGHSRGGAIAQIVARELQKKGIPAPMVLYGSKRTGNLHFVRHLWDTDLHSVHYRNRGDWVPLLPPWYARLPEVITAKPWQPLIRAHLDYQMST